MIGVIGIISHEDSDEEGNEREGGLQKGLKTLGTSVWAKISFCDDKPIEWLGWKGSENRKYASTPGQLYLKIVWLSPP